MSNTVSKAALTNSNVFSNLIHCLLYGDELILKRSPDNYQRLVLMKGIYHVKYSVRNSLDQLKHFKQYIFTAS